MSSNTSSVNDFAALGLLPEVLRALQEVGYETPSAIQARTIPALLAGRDVLGQAQTGTGKTAAFALPMLGRIELRRPVPQVLVLTPTRELAIQVAEAFQRYAAHLSGFHVLPIYGGQDYSIQLRQLKRGPQVIVGTPGRVMDHMRRGTLKLDNLKCLVLDEADEMLRMGFIDDVEWILEQTPGERQVALFSATLPDAIRRIARRHLRDPQEVTIEVRTTTAEAIEQRYWLVSGLHKLDALTRILEAETFDGMIIFVRTKLATIELAEKLAARGYGVAALNGDIQQKSREKIVERFKAGGLDILVATDVAARGLDVDRVSHVINYDIPHDTESYVHRIGRTGRFGRKGIAILFVAPRERNMLQAIEKATRQKIALMDLPSTEMLNSKRISQFMQRITDTLAAEDLTLYRQLIETYQAEHNIPAVEIAAGLARLVQGNTPLLLKEPARPAPPDQRQSKKSGGKPVARDGESDRPRSRAARKVDDTDAAASPTHRHGQDGGERPPRREAGDTRDQSDDSVPGPRHGMERYRIAVGKRHGVKPGDIVGVIASEAGLTSRNIDRITIREDHTTVDLPEGMPRDIYRDLKRAVLAGQKLDISKLESPRPRREKTAFGKGRKPAERKKNRPRPK